MGLTSALQIGRSALVYSQAGMQVTGNNMANATTPGYTRQIAMASPMRGERINGGTFIGRGVYLRGVDRAVDEAIQARIRYALADENSAQVDQRLLAQLESLQNELSDSDISSALTEFFNTWSELANSPEDDAVRTLVVQEGVSLSSRLQFLREDYANLMSQVDVDLSHQVLVADEIMTQIAGLNSEIIAAEQGRGTAGSLRDQRDQLLNELSGFMDVNVIERESGAVDVLVGSIPIVFGDQSRGLEFVRESKGDTLEAFVRVKTDGSRLNISNGSVGALLENRDGEVQDAIETLDELAAALIHTVNRIHSQGQGAAGFESVTGTYSLEDTTVPLNDSLTNLPFEITNGSFVIHMTDEASGARTEYRINIDLDGVGADMSLDGLVTEINTVVGASLMTASVTPDGRLQLDAVDGYTMGFSDDTSGALAALGINTYFTGKNAVDINVNELLLNRNDLLAAGSGHTPGSNGTALAIAGAGDEEIARLNGTSINNYWLHGVGNIATHADTANLRASTTVLVRESLEAQESAVSGVSLDEEAINLMNFQQQYGAAARYLSLVNEMMDTLMRII